MEKFPVSRSTLPGPMGATASFAVELALERATFVAGDRDQPPPESLNRARICTAPSEWRVFHASQSNRGVSLPFSWAGHVGSGTPKLSVTCPTGIVCQSSVSVRRYSKVADVSRPPIAAGSGTDGSTNHRPAATA